MIVLCLDPGLTTGVAVLDFPRAGPPHVVNVTSTPFHLALIDLVVGVKPAVNPGQHADDISLVVVEDGSDLPVYERHNAVGGRPRDTLVRGVGQTDARAQTLVAVAREMGHRVHTVPPHGAKWDAETLAARTGYTERTNEHGRDAVRAGMHPSVRAAVAQIAADGARR